MTHPEENLHRRPEPPGSPRGLGMLLLYGRRPAPVVLRPLRPFAPECSVNLESSSEFWKGFLFVSLCSVFFFFFFSVLWTCDYILRVHALTLGS